MPAKSDEAKQRDAERNRRYQKARMRALRILSQKYAREFQRIFKRERRKLEVE